jgi:hypothetical protein
MASNAVSLVPATTQELECWRNEAIQARQEFLKNNATPDQLRLVAGHEFAANQQAQFHGQPQTRSELHSRMEFELDRCLGEAEKF